MRGGRGRGDVDDPRRTLPDLLADQDPDPFLTCGYRIHQFGYCHIHSRPVLTLAAFVDDRRAETGQLEQGAQPRSVIEDVDVRNALHLIPLDVCDGPVGEVDDVRHDAHIDVVNVGVSQRSLQLPPHNFGEPSESLQTASVSLVVWTNENPILARRHVLRLI